MPFPPGGGSDAIARLIADLLAMDWAQPAAIDNRAGAAGVIGAGYVARSADDGHTLLQTNFAVVTNNCPLHPTLADRTVDFGPVMEIASVGLSLVTASGSPHRSLRQLLAMPAEARARISAVGRDGTTAHLALEKLKRATGPRFSQVPCRGVG